MPIARIQLPHALLFLGAVLLGSLCLAAPALGASGAAGGLNWTSTSATAVTITGCVGACPTHVAIPSTITDGGTTYAVTGIGENAFSAAILLEGITIPDGVTSIGNDAFSWTTALEGITIPDSVTSLGTNAFESSGVSTAVLPTNPAFTTIPDRAFLNATQLGSITIPDSVTSIAAFSFMGTTDLGSIAFGALSRLETVGDYAFWLTGLRSIRFPYGLASIGNQALHMSYLTTLEFLGPAPTATDIFDQGHPNGPSPIVHRFANAAGWPDMSARFQGRPQAPLLLVLPPTALVATAGTGSATVALTAPAYGPAPDGYSVTAVQDGNTTCSIAAPATSCTVAGLAAGATYTFTARSTTMSPALTSDPSSASNAITPPSPSPADVPAATDGASTSTSTSTSPTVQPGWLRSSSSAGPTSIITTFTASGPGAATQIGTVASLRRHGRSAGRTVCTTSLTVLEAGRATIVCRLGNPARQARMAHALNVTLTTTFTATGGTPMSSTRIIRLARTAAPKAPVAPSTTPSGVTG